MTLDEVVNLGPRCEISGILSKDETLAMKRKNCSHMDMRELQFHQRVLTISNPHVDARHCVNYHDNGVHERYCSKQTYVIKFQERYEKWG